jgi:hypothetical protein
MKFFDDLKWLICLVFVFFALNASGAPPDHAKGSPPTKTYWLEEFGEAFEGTFPFADCGGFETEITVQISGFWINHTDHPQRETWEFFHSAFPTSIANASDPSIYVEGIPGQSINRLWFDGPFQDDAIETGVQLMVTLPGYGVIIRDVGRIVYDWAGGEVKFLAGEWDTKDGDFDALCSVLSG